MKYAANIIGAHFKDIEKTAGVGISTSILIYHINSFEADNGPGQPITRDRSWH